jgi:hypothetical protein
MRWITCTMNPNLFIISEQHFLHWDFSHSNFELNLPKRTSFLFECVWRGTEFLFRCLHTHSNSIWRASHLSILRCCIHVTKNGVLITITLRTQMITSLFHTRLHCNNIHHLIQQHPRFHNYDYYYLYKSSMII